MVYHTTKSVGMVYQTNKLGDMRWNSQSSKVEGLDPGFSRDFQVEGLDPGFLFAIHKHQAKISRFFIGYYVFLWIFAVFNNP
jgi:hypothetical protein